MTQIDDPAKKGSLGVALTRLAVEKYLAWAFREQPLPDIGIDVQLEVVNGSTATGRLLAVQIKSGASYFRSPAGDGWWFSDTAEHFTYWLNHTCPVLIVLCDLETETCYWQLVNEETVVRSADHRWKLWVPSTHVLDSRAVVPLDEAARHPSDAHRSRLALGTRIAEVDARTLDVRLWPVAPGTSVRSPPPYISRTHDRELDELVAAALQDPPNSGTKILVGESSTGKTRALFEAVHRWVADAEPRSLADAGWRVWPRVEISPQQFLDGLHDVGPQTVIWLNEAQRYLLEPSPEVGEAIATELHSLVTDPDRGPILVLGTLWPAYWETSMQRPPAVRLLRGNYLRVPGAFTTSEQEAARASGDSRLVEAAGRAQDGEIAQYLSGVPALRQRYEVADSRQRAIIHAAMDARRFGHTEWFPAPVLAALAQTHVTGSTLRAIEQDPGWFESAVESLTRAGDSAALLHEGPSGFRLEDYLDQLGRDERMFEFPPQAFWDVVFAAGVTPENLVALADNAVARIRFGIAMRLYQAARTRTAGRGLLRLALRYELNGQHGEAEYLVRAASEIGFPEAMTELAEYRHYGRSKYGGGVEGLLRDGVDAADPRAFTLLANILEKRGDHAAAEALAQAAALRGHWQAMAVVAEWRDLEAPDEAEAMIWGLPRDLRAMASTYLVISRDDSDDHWDAECLADDLAADGDWEVLLALADNRLNQHDEESADKIYEKVARATGTVPVPGERHRLANVSERAPDTTDSASWDDNNWLDRDSERAEVATSATTWLIGRGMLDLAEKAALEAAENGVPAGLVELGRGWLRRGERNRADELALLAINTADVPEFDVSQDPGRLLAEVRDDSAVLLAGLDADGSTAALPDHT